MIGKGRRVGARWSAKGASSPTQHVSSSLTTWHVAGTYNAGYWSVSATGTVSNSQTYGFCRNP